MKKRSFGSRKTEQVMALAKMLIDSLNESDLAKRIPPQPPNTRSLKKLEAFLAANGVEGALQVTFLHNLWNLRHGTPHRKGEGYEKAAKSLALESVGLSALSRTSWEQAIELIEFLRRSFPEVQAQASQEEAQAQP